MFSCVHILGLAKTELIFPIAALLVLSFIFVDRKVLITHSPLATAEQFLHSIKAISTTSPPSSPKGSRLRVGKNLGGDIARTAEPN